MKKGLFSISLFLLTFLAEAQFQTIQIITGLQYPIAFTFTPQNRILLTLKAGQIMYYDTNYTLIGTFYDLSDSTYDNAERGLLGIEVDPDYLNNSYVYAYYNHRCCNPAPSGTQYLRVVRFTEVGNVGTNPTLIFNQMVSNTIPGNHVGGNIRFRPSEPNQIYITIGELATPAYSQQLTNPYGKILRLNKDGTIPASNPYYDDGNPTVGNDDRIWSLGHRNSFDFSFSTFNDSLYSTENGENTYDEINYGLRGKNYGWPVCEGSFIYSSASPCSNPSYTNPLAVFGSPVPSVTGILHYTSSLMPLLTNHLLVADNDYGNVYDLTLGNPPSYDTLLSQVQLIDLTSTGGLTTLKQGSEGCFYAMKGGYTTAGNITRVCPIDFYIIETEDLITEINTFPIPASDELTIEFFLKKAAFIRFELAEITGRQIYMTDLINYQNGVNQISLSAQEVPAGMYLGALISSSGTKSFRISIAR